MAKTVTVGCKLPNGLIITVGEKSIKLNGFMKGATIIGGYGMTDDVDEALFNKWLKDHSDRKIVKNKLVFKAVSLKEATAEAKDTAEKQSGFEQINTTENLDPDLKKFDPEK